MAKGGRVRRRIDQLPSRTRRLVELMKEGKIKIDIAHKYSLDEAQKSHEDLHARKLLGPAILIP